MAIMYDPQQGMATFVPDGMENDYLAKGYRTTPPEERQKVNTSSEDEDEGEIPGSVKVNSATLKELTERLGLSTAQAKELRDGRPYATVEDLIAKIADIDWVTLSPQISFE